MALPKSKLPIVQVCAEKLACWRNGGEEVYDALRGHTDMGKLFDLQAVKCQGTCHLSPSVTVYCPDRDKGGTDTSCFRQFGISSDRAYEVTGYNPTNVQTLLDLAFEV